MMRLLLLADLLRWDRQRRVGTQRDDVVINGAAVVITARIRALRVARLCLGARCRLPTRCRLLAGRRTWAPARLPNRSAREAMMGGGSSENLGRARAADCSALRRRTPAWARSVSLELRRHPSPETCRRAPRRGMSGRTSGGGSVSAIPTGAGTDDSTRGNEPETSFFGGRRASLADSLERGDVRNGARIGRHQPLVEESHSCGHLNVVVPGKPRFYAQRAHDALHRIDAELEGDLPQGRVRQRSIDRQHDGVFGTSDGNETVPDCELARQYANGPRSGACITSSRVPGRRPKTAAQYRVHRILAHGLQLEQHGVEVAPPNDLLLDRFLNPLHGDHLITDQKRCESRHT